MVNTASHLESIRAALATVAASDGAEALAAARAGLAEALHGCLLEVAQHDVPEEQRRQLDGGGRPSHLHARTRAGAPRHSKCKAQCPPCVSEQGVIILKIENGERTVLCALKMWRRQNARRGSAKNVWVCGCRRGEKRSVEREGRSRGVRTTQRHPVPAARQ